MAGCALGWSSPALAAPGALDPTFGSGGVLAKQLGGGTAPFTDGNAIARQADGKLVSAGDTTDASGAEELLVIRLNPGGSFDSTFGGSGAFTRQLGASGSPQSDAVAIALQPDGKIVVAGAATDASGNSQVMAARLNPNGTLDSTFGGGSGVVLRQLGAGGSPFSQANGLALQGDGKIVLAGFASQSGNDQSLIARLNPDGSPDASFAGGAVLHQYGLGGSPQSFFNSVAIQSDGRVVAAGGATDATSTNDQVLVARFTPAGAPDTTFAGGAFITQLGAGSSPTSNARGLALQPDGRIVIDGPARDAAGHGALFVARLTAAGTLDSSFAGFGFIRPQLGQGSSPNSRANGLALQPDGKVVIAGNASDPVGHLQLMVARVGANGGLDAGFGSGGVFEQQFSQGPAAFSSATKIALQPDGKVVSAGDVRDSAGHLALLATRLLGDPPAISAFRQAHKKWRRTKKLPVVSRKRRGHKRVPKGTAFTFNLNESAQVTLTFKHAGKVRGRIVLTGHPGLNKVAFGGRLDRRHRLKPGRYRVIVTAAVPGETTASASLRFRIVK